MGDLHYSFMAPKLKGKNFAFANTSLCLSSSSSFLLLLSSYVSLSSSQLQNPNMSSIDHLALLSFKSLISDDPFGALASWNESLTFCRWQGVACGDYSGERRVIALELESLDLAGKISPSIANLTFLQRLHLPDNKLQGPIPQELGMLSFLRHLNLSSNSLGGMIPPVTLFQNCSLLKNLSLDKNNFSGRIPHNISNCLQLESLDLSYNFLEGEIPGDLSSLLNLKELALGRNNLTGSIPLEIGNLSSLVVLYLSHNQLTGEIPRNLSQCAALKYLYLADNMLEGAIPDDLGELQKLKVLSIFGNQITGGIPPGIWNIFSVEEIRLHENKISGTLPPEVGNLVNLSILSLRDNNLSGFIPPEIGKPGNLTLLVLHRNQFIGTIPPEIGNLVGLIRLFLGENQLIGMIPSEIGNLVNLDLLHLGFNRLTGTVPVAIGNLSSLTVLVLSFNNLTGFIPPSFWNMSSIKIFQILSNSFMGSLPSNIGITLPYLEDLGVGGNFFFGPIPNSLSNSSNLESIQLLLNNFTGTIPRGFGSLQSLFHFDLSYNQLEARNVEEWGFLEDLTNCSNLKWLQLTSNKLSGSLPQSIRKFSSNFLWFEMNENYISGTIPAWVGNIDNLTFFQMRSNRLTGNIPAIMGNISRLQIIDLSENYFTGEIPNTFGNLNDLVELNLCDNHLQGFIPPSLGDCPLNLLDLSHNKLDGVVPKEILSIPTLTRLLNISHNSLQGHLPSEIGNLRNLGKLDLSANKLSGEIPVTLGECQQLEYIDMSGNYFLGSIPSTFSNLKGLQSLDLSRNILSGNIPELLGNLKLLSYLNLSFNKFEGQVPIGGIFKNVTAFSVSGNNRLCGGNQNLNLASCPTSTKKHLSRKIIVIISVFSGMVCLILLFSLLVTLYWLNKSKKKPVVNSHIKDSHMKVSYVELLRATDNLSDSNLIGVGSYGSVYKGILTSHENSIVAVKVLNLQIKGASRSFIAECDILRSIRHRNLVKILTACASTDFRGNDFKALVYEFMSNGNLDDWLHLKANAQGQTRRLGFTQRVNILIDVASALDYLHHHGGEPVVHCDIKPSNVLLDDNMVAHLGDFGLARFLQRHSIDALQGSSSSIMLKGSIGYIPPEYGVANKVSAEGDVYSYGILVLEMLTGKRSTSENFNGGVSLPQYVETTIAEGTTDVLDPNLHLEEEFEGADEHNQGRAVEFITLLLEIGVKCAKELPQERMHTEDIISELMAIRKGYMELKLQVRAEQNLTQTIIIED